MLENLRLHCGWNQRLKLLVTKMVGVLSLCIYLGILHSWNGTDIYLYIYNIDTENYFDIKRDLRTIFYKFSTQCLVYVKVETIIMFHQP